MIKKSEYIIVLDDDPMTHRIIEDFTGVKTVTFIDPHQLLRKASQFHPIAVFLDIHLDSNILGLELIQPLQKIWNHTPIFIMTSHNDKPYIKESLSLGADDFIEKPLKKEIICARLLKHVSDKSERFSYADVIFDDIQSNIQCNKKVSPIPKKEMAILKLMIRIPGMMTTREDILNRIWGGTHLSPNTLDKKIQNIRQILIEIGSLIQIETIYGKGFKISHEKHKTRHIKNPKKPKVLIVDDNHLNLTVSQAMLEPFCDLCEIADDGDIAEKKHNKYLFDLILMDCQMPRQDGFITTQNILAKKTEKTPLIVAFIGKNDKFLDKKCKSSGMGGVLFKPLDIDDFLNLIKKWSTSIHAMSKKKTSLSISIPLIDFDNSTLSPQRIHDLLSISHEHSKKFLLEVFELFRNHGSEVHNELQNEKDLYKIGRKSHKLRGMAANIGALKLESLLNTIEEASDNKWSYEKISSLIKDEKIEFEKIKKEIDILIKQNE
ncbi:MAG: response regulator [Oligoflexales bacterium]